MFRSKQRPDGSIYIHWQDVGEVVVSRTGRDITCRPFAQGHLESFYAYLLGHALSFALVKIGLEPLHATAIAFQDQAVAFVGGCGFGKSTLAAAFLQAGFRLLTDDLLLLQITADGILAYPGPPRIKLFPEVARRFIGAEARGIPLNPAAEKQIISLNEYQTCSVAVPLKMIYVLAPSSISDTRICITPLAERQAFVSLLGNTFNRVLVDSERLKRHFRAAEALVKAAVVRQLSYLKNFESLPLVIRSVMTDVSLRSAYAVGDKA